MLMRWCEFIAGLGRVLAAPAGLWTSTAPAAGPRTALASSSNCLPIGRAVTTSSIFLDGLADLVKRPAAARSDLALHTTSTRGRWIGSMPRLRLGRGRAGLTGVPLSCRFRVVDPSHGEAATPFPCNRPRDRLRSRSAREIRMRRRDFIAGLGSVAAWPVVALAQQPTMPVIGFEYIGSADAGAERLPAFRKGLGETGYVEGENVTVEYH